MSFTLSRRHLIGGATSLTMAALAPARAHAATEPEDDAPFAPHSFGVLQTPRTLPALSVKDELGRDVALSTYHGRPFILHFWATWCPPCIAELPSVNATARAMGAGGPPIVAVAVRGSTVPKVRAFYDTHGIDSLPLLVDPVSAVMIETANEAAMRASLRQTDPESAGQIGSDSFALHAVPRSLILNAKGQVVAEAVGGLRWSADAVRATVKTFT